MKRLLRHVGLLAGILLGVIQTVFAGAYTITDLGALSGSSAFGISELGHVAGSTYWTAGPGTSHAFRYDGGATIIDLGTLADGGQSVGQGINDQGQVVGYSTIDSDPYVHAIVHDGSTLIDLGTLGGAQSDAYGINNSGQITGYAWTTVGHSRAFLFKDGVMTSLGTLGGSNSVGAAINESGQVAGYSEEISGLNRAFLFDGNAMINLGTLGGDHSFGAAINSSGQVAGGSQLDGNSVQHAFLYDGSNLIDLGALFVWDSFAEGINDMGHVVGWSYVDGPYGTEHAFLYNGYEMLDLNDLIDAGSGWILRHAYDINNNGQIVGYGEMGGVARAFLLTPVAAVPEPSSIALLLMGGVGLVAYGWRKRQQSSM